MRRFSVQSFAAVLALAFGSVTASAESINPATKPQVAPMTKQEKKNLDIVLNWWREVIYAGHMELAPKYQAENYIQHNPNINTGRAAFVEMFGRIRKPMNPIPAAMPPDSSPVVAGAKGDFVWLIFEASNKDPRNEANTYFANTFDVIRVEKGLVQEHWDSLRKRPGRGEVNVGVSPKPPSQWSTGKLSKAAFPSETRASWLH